MAAVDVPTAVKTPFSPLPCGDRLTIPFRFNWDTISEYELDFNNAIQQTKIDSVQSFWIDNLDNVAALTVEIDGTDQRIRVPAASIGAFPVITREIPRMTITSVIGVDQTTRILMNNFPLPMHTYTP